MNVYVIQRYNWDVGWMAVNDLFYTDKAAAELCMKEFWLPNETKDTVRVHKLSHVPDPEVEKAKKILESITPEDIDNVKKALVAGVFLMAGGPRTHWVEQARQGIEDTYRKLHPEEDTSSRAPVSVTRGPFL